MIYTKYFDLMTEYFNQRIDEKIKGERFVNFSAYKTDKMGVPINNIDDIAVKGTVRFHQKHDPFWSRCGKDYMSRPVTNPTWLQVAVLANEMIKTTGDKQHIFLEGVKKYGDKAKFAMGS